MRQQVGAGTGNHQLAHTVDEVIEFAGMHSDQTGFFGFLVLHAALFVRSGRNEFGLHLFLFNQDFTQTRGGLFMSGCVGLGGLDAWCLLLNQATL